VLLLPVGQVPQEWATAWTWRPFSSALAPLAVFGVFFSFLIFKFSTASARTPPKIKFLFLWHAANGVHRKFTHEIWYFLSSSEYRAEKQTRKKALAACLPLAHSYG